MVPVAGYYMNRAVDAADEARLMDVFRTVYRAEIDRILDGGSAVMAKLDAAPDLSRQQAG